MYNYRKDTQYFIINIAILETVDEHIQLAQTIQTHVSAYQNITARMILGE